MNTHDLSPIAANLAPLSTLRQVVTESQIGRTPTAEELLDWHLLHRLSNVEQGRVLLISEDDYDRAISLQNRDLVYACRVRSGTEGAACLTAQGREFLAGWQR